MTLPPKAQAVQLALQAYGRMAPISTKQWLEGDFSQLELMACFLVGYVGLTIEQMREALTAGLAAVEPSEKTS